MKDNTYKLTLKFKETGAKITIEEGNENIIGDPNKNRREILACIHHLLHIVSPNPGRNYELLMAQLMAQFQKSNKDDSQKNPYFDRFEIHGTDVFWKRKVIFFKNGKKVKIITGWKDHMYCTDCLFEKNKIVDLLTMPDETMNCPFCNGPMLEVS